MTTASIGYMLIVFIFAYFCGYACGCIDARGGKKLHKKGGKRNE